MAWMDMPTMGQIIMYLEQFLEEWQLLYITHGTHNHQSILELRGLGPNVNGLWHADHIDWTNSLFSWKFESKNLETQLPD